jgi:hypothetical protein
MITENHTQECLSLAFVHALTGVAGVNLALGNPNKQRRHDYGIDGTFHPVSEGSRRLETGFPVDFQMKSTVNWDVSGSDIVYDLEAQTYNDLVGRDPYAVPCILILLCLPKSPEEWLVGSETEMVLRNCCYWEKLTGEPTENSSTRRIRIPRKNLLTPDGIRQILKTERAKWKTP